MLSEHDARAEVEHHEAPQEVFEVAEEGLLCLEELHVSPAVSKLFLPQFCKIFRIEPTLGSVLKAKEAVLHDEVFARNPKFNVSFAVNSVFRIMRTNVDSSFEFATGWLVSPPIPIPYSHGTTAFLAMCAGHPFLHEKDGKKVASYRGCFGAATDIRSFRSMGFGIDTQPLYFVNDDDADLAIIRFLVTDEERALALPETVKFLLPCSPSVYGTEGLTAFGYPGINSFLQNAEKVGIDSLWKKYSDVFKSKAELYDAIGRTLAGMSSGDLCCSPTRVLETTGNCARVRSSTIPGNSGSPLLSNVVEGMACYVFRGTDVSGHEAVNLATGLDQVGFVHAYKEYVLPFVPSQMPGRSTAPFKEWCAQHRLDWHGAVSASN